MSKRYYKELNQDNISNIIIPRGRIGFDKRFFRWIKQRHKYGFDDRETWSLDNTSLIWIYEHLRMLEDIGGKIVDLGYTPFFPIEIKESIKDCGIKEEINCDLDTIHVICDMIRDYFCLDEIDNAKDRAILFKKIFFLCGIIGPRLWW